MAEDDQIDFRQDDIDFQPEQSVQNNAAPIKQLQIPVEQFYNPKPYIPFTGPELGEVVQNANFGRLREDNPNTFVGPKDPRSIPARMISDLQSRASEFASNHPTLTRIAQHTLTGENDLTEQKRKELNAAEWDSNKGIQQSYPDRAKFIEESRSVEGPGMMKISGIEPAAQAISKLIDPNDQPFYTGIRPLIAGGVELLGDTLASGLDPRTAGIKPDQVLRGRLKRIAETPVEANALETPKPLSKELELARTPEGKIVSYTNPAIEYDKNLTPRVIERQPIAEEAKPELVRENKIQIPDNNPKVVQAIKYGFSEIQSKFDSALTAKPIETKPIETNSAITPITRSNKPVIDAISSTGNRDAYIYVGKTKLKVQQSNYGDFGRRIGADIKLSDGSEISADLVDQVLDDSGKVLWSKTNVPARESLLKGETDELKLRGFKKDETKALRNNILNQIGNSDRVDLASIFEQHSGRVSRTQFDKVVQDIIDSGDAAKALQAAQATKAANVPIIARDLGTAQTPEEALDILLDNVQAHTTARIEQDALLSAEKKGRIRQAMNVRSTGVQGYFDSLKKLKGEYPKIQAQMRAELASPENANLLMDQVRNHPGLSDWDKIGTQTALAKALGLREFRGALQPSEIEDLTRVFGRRVTERLQEMHSGLFIPSGMRTYEGLSKVGGYVKSLKASADFPGIFRAGINYAGQKEWRQAVLPGLRSYFSPKYADNVLEQLKRDPIYETAYNNGLAITNYKHASPLMREEALASLGPEKIPVLGKVVAASNRGQTVFTDVLRLEKYKSLTAKYKTLYESLKKDAKPDELEEIEKLNPANPYRGKLIADEINVASGRGKLPGRFEHLSSDLNNLFFSPRLMSARIRSINRILNPAKYVTYNKIQRTEALKQLLSIAGVIGSTSGIANLMGYSTGKNYLSTDYLKNKRGDTRLDSLGGYQQIIVPALRLLSGATASSEGNVRLLGDYGAPSAVDLGEQFLENKASPFLSFAMSLAKGEEMGGKPNDFRNLNPFENTATRQLVVPMITQDLYDLFTHEPDLMQTLAIVPSSLGMSIQTYNKDDYKKEKQKRELERKQKLADVKARISALTR